MLARDTTDQETTLQRRPSPNAALRTSGEDWKCETLVVGPAQVAASTTATPWSRALLNEAEAPIHAHAVRCHRLVQKFHCPPPHGAQH